LFYVIPSTADQRPFPRPQPQGRAALIFISGINGEIDADRLAAALSAFLRSALAMRAKLQEVPQQHPLKEANSLAVEDATLMMMRV
jgi:hypothetical protein